MQWLGSENIYTYDTPSHIQLATAITYLSSQARPYR